MIEHYPFPPALKAGWRGDEPPERTFPAPSRTSAMPQPGHVYSDPVRQLAALGELHGWTAFLTTAEGHVPHSTHGTPSKVAKSSEAVRLSRGDERAVAVRMNGSWASMWTWSTTTFFVRHRLLEEFRTALT